MDQCSHWLSPKVVPGRTAMLAGSHGSQKMLVTHGGERKEKEGSDPDSLKSRSRGEEKLTRKHHYIRVRHDFEKC